MNSPGQAGRDGAHGAGGTDDGDPFFVLDADDDVVYEWIDEDDDPEAAKAARGPRRPLRERLTECLAAARAEARQLRRRAGAAGLAVVLVAGAAVGFTTWYDAVAGAADRADVVALAVDSIVNGDPAAGSVNTSGNSATLPYIVEIANNGQDPIAVRDVKADGGTLMASKSWKPVGSPTIPAGGTGRIELTMRIDCTIAMFGGLLSIGDGTASMPFPDLDVTVATQSGAVHSTRLSTKQDVRPDRTLDDIGVLPALSPRVVMADTGPCLTQLESRNLAENQQTPALVPAGPSAALSGPLASVAYTGMEATANGGSKTFRAKFHVAAKQTPGTTVPVTISRPFSDDGNPSQPYTLTMLPKTVTVPNGGQADFVVQVQILDCLSTGDGMFPDTGQLQILAVQDDPALGRNPSTVLNQELGSVVTDTVRLALDEIAQNAAACG